MNLHNATKKPHVVLTTSQGNDVFRLIERNGLDPHAFRWDETAPFSHRPHPADLLLYTPAGKRENPEVFFAFGRHRLGCSPGSERLYEEWTAGEWQEQILPCVALWLTNVKRESGPSLWESVPLETLRAVPGGRFAPEEQAILATRMRELEQRLTALDSLTPDQRKLVRDEVRRIADAAPRMEKPEWLRFALGCMLTVVLGSSIRNNVGASLMRWAVSTFQGMVATTARYLPEERRSWHRLSLR